MNLNDRLNRLSPEQRAKLASRLSSAKRPEAGHKPKALPQVQPDAEHRFEPFPLSDIQQAYLIGRSEGVELGNVGCHNYFELDLEAWNRERFEAALNRVIQRHEMLRAIILPDGRQQVLQHVPQFHVQCQDLRGLPPEAVAAQIEALREKMSHHLYRTDCWPLFDFRVSRLDDRRARLHISIDMLIADGRSFEILFAELSQLYLNPETSLPPLQLSFRDYIFASNSIEETDAFAQSSDYWLKRVPTLPPAPELPLAANPASITHPRCKRRCARIDSATWSALKEKTTQLNLTPAGIVLAAFSEVLAIWSKHPRFTINLTLFNRLPLHPESNDIIGDFTALDLLEVDNSKPESFEARARRQKEQLWQDLDHRHFSGVRVMRELIRQQGAGPKAIMPVVFTSLLGLGSSKDGAGWTGRLGKTAFAISQTPQVYFDFMCIEDAGELVLNWDTVEELFPAALLDDLFQAYQSLLKNLAVEETSWEHTLAQNAQKLLPAWQGEKLRQANETAAPVSDELLHTPFLKQVQQRPAEPAVCTPSRRLTYAELYHHACAVEEELLQRNVRPNQFVAVVMEKGWEQVVAVLGTHFAGGAYMPVDPELPAERQRYLIENGDVKIVLTQSAVRAKVSAPEGVEVIVVDELKPAKNAPLTPRRRQKPEDLAYVIYTSGSTGLPKGVMIDHRGAMNTVLDINRRFAVGPQDCVLALSRLNFDLSVYDIFGLLAAGGTIVMPAAELAQDAAHWVQLVAAEKVTLWNTVPALMQLLVEEAGEGGKLGQSLRVIMMSGDWIPVPLPGQIRKLLPNAEIFSLGGATEASIWSILYPIVHVGPNWKSVPYGKPMVNQTFHVLSDSLTPCPVWVPGQLYIGGIGLAKGYWRDESKTAAHFIKNPHSGESLYRTGDWGRYLPDGNIEFLGREDSQVKVQGYRIELGEIEVKLQEYPGIESCVVIVREDKPREKRLVGYLVPRPGAQLEPAAIRQFLQTKLAHYMVPSAIVPLERIPLTPNGKVDRKALPATVTSIEAASDAAAPRDMLEAQLIKLWEKVLKVEPVGLRDNFFDLGGHSLTAVRLFTELRKMTGRTLALSTLFQAPTIEKLAEILRTDGWSSNWETLVPIRATGSRPPFFCVHGAGGNVLLFNDLARLLGEDYPFYGIQAYGLDGSKEYLKSIEEMAVHYLKEIRALQPRGPYYLGGFCMGGQVAYEMAQLLRKEGEQVALLAMIDTYNFHGIPLHMSLHEKLVHARDKIGFHWTNFVRLSLKQELAYMAKKLKGAVHREIEKAIVWYHNVLRISHHPTAGGVRNIALEMLNEEAHFAYVAASYPERVTIFKPQRNYAFVTDEKMGWGEFVPELEMVELPVDPGGIFVEPYVKVLADGLRERIDAAAQPKEQRVRISLNPKSRAPVNEVHENGVHENEVHESVPV